MEINMNIFARSVLAILATSIFLGMFSVFIMGNRDLIELVMKMFNTIIVAVILVTIVINLDKIIKAVRT